jgi:hypothetical protein
MRCHLRLGCDRSFFVHLGDSRQSTDNDEMVQLVLSRRFWSNKNVVTSLRLTRPDLKICELWEAANGSILMGKCASRANQWMD